MLTLPDAIVAVVVPFATLFTSLDFVQKLDNLSSGRL